MSDDFSSTPTARADRVSSGSSASGEKPIAADGPEIVRVSNDGIARSGRFGRSESGNHGISATGFGGFAKTEAYGLAVAEEQGEAVAGDHGVAVSDGKRHGSAAVGDDGVAIGRGRHKTVTAGTRGVSIISGTGTANAGAHGIAISHNGQATAGRAGIAIGKVVSGDMESLLVAVNHDLSTGAQNQAMGVVGQSGIEPFVLYYCAEGGLTPTTSLEDVNYKDWRELSGDDEPGA